MPKITKTMTQSVIRDAQGNIDEMSRASTLGDLNWHWGAATSLLNVSEAWNVIDLDTVASLRMAAHDTYRRVAASIAFAH